MADNENKFHNQADDALVDEYGALKEQRDELQAEMDEIRMELINRHPKGVHIEAEAFTATLNSSKMTRIDPALVRKMLGDKARLCEKTTNSPRLTVGRK